MAASRSSGDGWGSDSALILPGRKCEHGVLLKLVEASDSPVSGFHEKMVPGEVTLERAEAKAQDWSWAGDQKEELGQV
jgi:hypothetical protein